VSLENAKFGKLREDNKNRKIKNNLTILNNSKICIMLILFVKPDSELKKTIHIEIHFFMHKVIKLLKGKNHPKIM